MNHINLFSQLSSGKLKSMLSGKCTYPDVLSVVRSVNTKILYHNIASSDVPAISDSIDFQSLGYRSPDDFSISTSTGKAPEFLNISITPVCVYDLNDDFSLPKAPDKRSKIIQALLCDEFERIKNRALYYLESTNDEKVIKVYAIKNRMFIKTCFHTHKPKFHDLFSLYPDYLRHPDAFIHYSLNFFLIRLRLFYEKLFEDFLGDSKKTEKQLLAELFQYNPALMQGRIISPSSSFNNDSLQLASEPEENEYPQSSTQLQPQLDSASSLARAFQTISSEYKIPAAKIRQLVELSGKFKWNGQVNSLADVLYQLMYEHKSDGKPLLVTVPNDIANLISILCVDRDGQQISKSSLKTCMQPEKKDKRPKPESKGKIVL